MNHITYFAFLYLSLSLSRSSVCWMCDQVPLISILLLLLLLLLLPSLLALFRLYVFGKKRRRKNTPRTALNLFAALWLDEADYKKGMKTTATTTINVPFQSSTLARWMIEQNKSDEGIDHLMNIKLTKDR